MQILQGRSASSDLPMSNAAINQLGIQPEVLRSIGKHEKLPTHYLHVGQHVMYQDSVSKQRHPAIIASYVKKSEATRSELGMLSYIKRPKHFSNLIHPKTRLHNQPNQ